MIEELKYGDCYMSFMVFFFLVVFSGLLVFLWGFGSHDQDCLISSIFFLILFIYQRKSFCEIGPGDCEKTFLNFVNVCFVVISGWKRARFVFIQGIIKDAWYKVWFDVSPKIHEKKICKYRPCIFYLFFFFIFLSLKKDVNPH